MGRIARGLAALSITLAIAATAAPARANEPLAFGLDWKAEAEYGGYYQALALGLYAKRGLDVTIRQGGPQLNQAQLLLAGRLDLDITSNSFLALNFVREGIPARAVAAMFQRDPAVLIAHPGQGNDDFASLRGKPILIGADTRAGWWTFLRQKFGYSDAQIRPYTFNLAPFLADQSAVQQGYVTSEPYAITQQAGFQPVVLLIADAGFQGYGSLIVARDDMIAGHADRVQRFLDASVEGWVSYLNGDPKPADEAIRRDNPEMTQALLDFGRTTLKARGILDSGDAARDGIGAMSDARWATFLADTAQSGVYPADLDVKRAYTLQFTNHRVGLDTPH